MILTHLPQKWPALLGSFAFLAMIFSSALAQQPSSDAKASHLINNTYQIRTGDKVSIKFLYQPELNEASVTVRPDGYISLSMIDQVMAKGLTVGELKSNIEKAYGETLLNPVVSINLVDFVSPRVYVGGQVTKPGSIELRSGQTLIQAIILAGGFTRDANRKMVLHARPAGGGQLKMQTFDVAHMFLESNGEDVLLQDGDYIFVPDSKLSKISRVIETFRALIPSIGIGY